MRRILSIVLAVLMLQSLFCAVCSASGKVLFPKDAKELSESGVSATAESLRNWNTGGYAGFGEVDFTGIKSVRLKANISFMVGDNGEAFRLYIDDALKGKCIGYIVINEEKSEPTWYGTNISGVT